MSTNAARNQFRKRLAILSLVFLSISFVITSLLMFDGPRIRKVVYDQSLLTQESNQTIILRSNQPLKPVDQSAVTIKPNVDFTVTAAGEAIVLQLKQRLNYDTAYSIKVAGLTASNGRSSNFETTIKTPGAQYYVLKRNLSSNNSGQPSFDGNKPTDVIKSGSLGGDESVVFEASKILDYSPLGDKLVVQTLSDNDKQELAIYDVGGANQQVIDLPEEGTLEQLAVSKNDRLIGFIFTSSSNDDGIPKINKRPYIFDTKANQLIPVRGVGNANLTVNSWRFHPDSTSLVIQTTENTTYIVDSYGKENPIPLGSYFSINDISDDGTQMVVGDVASNGPALLTFKDADATAYAQQKTGKISKYISEVQLLQSNQNSLQVSDVNESQAQKTYRLYELVRAGKRQPIYKISTEEGQALQSYVSSNDQYVAIEVAANAASTFFDSYPVKSMQSNVRVDIIDTTTGDKIKQTDGFKLFWQ